MFDSASQTPKALSHSLCCASVTTTHATPPTISTGPPRAQPAGEEASHPNPSHSIPLPPLFCCYYSSSLWHLFLALLPQQEKPITGAQDGCMARSAWASGCHILCLLSKVPVQFYYCHFRTLWKPSQDVLMELLFLLRREKS